MATSPAAPAQSNVEPPNFEPRSGAPAAWAIVALTAATVLIGALAPGGPARPAAPAEVACLEWSDGCRICRQLPEGPACSLPGIACTPAEPRCLLRAEGRARD